MWEWAGRLCCKKRRILGVGLLRSVWWGPGDGFISGLSLARPAEDTYTYYNQTGLGVYL